MEDEAGGDSQRAPEGGRRSGEEPRTGDERTAVQARTFTRWINLVLQTSDPPATVHDLFRDVRDGRILMALLEQLSGSRLRVFRLKNISKVLAFLDDHQVELLGVSSADVADGDPSAVLSLLWSIVLHFQVKQVVGGLQELSSRGAGNHGKTVGALLRQVQRCTSRFGVEVHDFGESWRSGLAFLALIKSVDPARVDLTAAFSREPRENLQRAFSTARRSLDVAPLLEPDDVLNGLADETSLVTYVSMFLQHCSTTDEDCSGSTGDAGTAGGSLRTGFGETPAIDPEARALLERSEASSEQQLWRKWSRRDQDPSSRKKDGPPNPPSPLDASVASPEIQSWMKKASDRWQEARRTYKSHFSLSSEEGVYSLSEDGEACSPGPDLSAGTFQPTPRPRALQRGGRAEERNRARSGADRTSGRNESSSGETVNTEPEGDVRKTGACGDESSIRGAGREEREGAGNDGYDEAEAAGDGATKINRSEADSCKKEREEQTERSVFEKGGRASGKTKSEEEEGATAVSSGQQCSSRTRGCSGICQTLSEGLAPGTSAGLSPSETQLLLLLWILVYCSFILHHMVS